MQRMREKEIPPTGQEMDAMDDLLFQDIFRVRDFPGRSGRTWRYKARGLNAGTTDEIAGQSANRIRMQNGEPVANLNTGRYYHLLLKHGVIEAPYPWTDENIKATPSEIRDVLIRDIIELSDGLKANLVVAEKNSDAPSADSESPTPE